MSIFVTSSVLILLLSTCIRAENNPPCRYNCPETEKLLCAAFNGESQTFVNKCQLELFNCLNRTKWQIVKKGVCDNQQ